MKEEIVMAGFGGQGIMSIGRLLAYAGMKKDYEVSWMPSYGPEMRGGTANCTVIVSSKRIPSPISSRPDSIIVMNLPSLEKFAPTVKPGGIIFLNSSLISEEPGRDDLEVYRLPCNKIANEIGSTRVASMVALGAYLQRKKIVDMEIVKNSLEAVFPKRRHNLIPINIEALDRGADLV